MKYPSLPLRGVTSTITYASAIAIMATVMPGIRCFVVGTHGFEGVGVEMAVALTLTTLSNCSFHNAICNKIDGKCQNKKHETCSK